MVTTEAARIMRLPDYGIGVGGPADMVLLDAGDAAGCVAQLAQPLWGMKAGRNYLHPPASSPAPAPWTGLDQSI